MNPVSVWLRLSTQFLPFPSLQAIMELEQKSPEYAFLFDLKSPEHTYYRCGTLTLFPTSNSMQTFVF